MKQKILIGLAIFLVVVGVVAYKAYNIYQDVKSAAVGGEIEGPKGGGWAKLEKDMSVEQVKDLLGEGLFVETSSGDETTTWLSYTYTNGVLKDLSEKGHNLLFINNKLIAWSQPGEKVPAIVKAEVKETIDTKVEEEVSGTDAETKENTEDTNTTTE